jgi:dCMP deaminase
MTDSAYLQACARIAASSSHDLSTHNAAIVARPEGGYVSAANRFPSGVKPRHNRPDKYLRIEHAERNAIYTAAATGFHTGGATMYCLWFACPDCARAIVCAGIYEVVGHVVPRQLTPPRWLEAIEEGERILREAGVGMRWLSVTLNATLLFDGRVIYL